MSIIYFVANTIFPKIAKIITQKTAQKAEIKSPFTSFFLAKTALYIAKIAIIEGRIPKNSKVYDKFAKKFYGASTMFVKTGERKSVKVNNILEKLKLLHH